MCVCVMAHVALASDRDVKINEQKVCPQIFATNQIHTHTRITVLQWAMHYNVKLRRSSNEIVCKTSLHLFCCKQQFRISKWQGCGLGWRQVVCKNSQKKYKKKNECKVKAKVCFNELQLTNNFSFTFSLSFAIPFHD